MKEIFFELDCDTSMPHFHNEMEILYVLDGYCAVMTDQTNYVLGYEDFSVFNPYEHHELHRGEGCHTLSAYISTDILEMAEIGQVNCCSKLQPEMQTYMQIIRRILALLYKQTMDLAGVRKLQILSSLCSLMDILKTQFQKPGTEYAAGYSDEHRMKEVLAYIGQHYSEEMSLGDLAERIHLSKSQLSRDFQKYMKIPYSEYLRKLRVEKAAYLLRKTRKSVTEIALECGFANTNTLITNFNQIYFCTPGAYRKKTLAESEQIGSYSSGTEYSFPILNLLKHATMEESALPLSKASTNIQRIEINTETDLGELMLCHDEVISLGWAYQLLQEVVRNSTRYAVKKIGLRYLEILGILDDTLDVYHENSEGDPWLSFTYIDMILDFILDTGAKPYLQLGFTPYLLVKDRKNVFENVASCVNLPDDLEKWSYLIHGLMEHLAERYGTEEIQKWIFIPVHILYASYGVFSIDEYLPYYKVTCDAVWDVLPKAVIYGPGVDTGFLEADGPEQLLRFLQYCRENDCMPKQLAVQCFCCDYSEKDRSTTEENISSRSDNLRGEPASPSRDESILQHQIMMCCDILDQNGFAGLPVSICSWNSTIWQNDLGNDTCFKAASVVKNTIELRKLVTGMAYAHLSDTTDRKIMNSNPYHGGTGVINYHGIPKAGFNAYKLLTYMKEKADRVIAEGDGYLITRSRNRKCYQFLLYNYCHYDFEKRIRNYVPSNDQKTIDRYMGFERKGAINLSFSLKNMIAGKYQKRTFSITRKNGSSYDTWLSIGVPVLVNELQKKHLKKISSIGVIYEDLYIGEMETLNVSHMLDEHEVCLILLEKK